MPLVQRTREKRPKRADATDQPWGMLVFESVSAGVMTVLVAMVAIMVVVGGYVMIVWPLTFWDLSHTGLERYGSWAETAMWSLFAGGALAGFWCFSGAAFKAGRVARVQRGKVEAVEAVGPTLPSRDVMKWKG